MLVFKRVAHGAAPGVYRRLQVAYSRVGDWLFDAYHGIDTDARPDDGVEDHTADSIEYKPTQIQILRRIFRMIEVGPDDVFLDLGAGKGRVVVQAAHLPFRRVVGVEISEALSTLARRNVERRRKRLACRTVEIVTADASTYAIPDDVTVVYLFNPFRGETFEKVARNIVASYERRPRRIALIYFLPTMHDTLIASGFRVVRALSGSLEVAGAPDAGRAYLVIYTLGADSLGTDTA